MDDFWKTGEASFWEPLSECTQYWEEPLEHWRARELEELSDWLILEEQSNRLSLTNPTEPLHHVSDDTRSLYDGHLGEYDMKSPKYNIRMNRYDIVQTISGRTGLHRDTKWKISGVDYPLHLRQCIKGRIQNNGHYLHNANRLSSFGSTRHEWPHSLPSTNDPLVFVPRLGNIERSRTSASKYYKGRDVLAKELDKCCEMNKSCRRQYRK